MHLQEEIEEFQQKGTKKGTPTAPKNKKGERAMKAINSISIMVAVGALLAFSVPVPAYSQRMMKEQ
jgi:hypothetical protein